MNERIRTMNGDAFCIDCYLTKMAEIQGYLLCGYCTNAQKVNHE